MRIFLSPFAPESLISRDRFGRSSRVILLTLHTQAESVNAIVLTNEIAPAFHGGVVCGVYAHHLEQSMDQPFKVANPARGRLNREN